MILKARLKPEGNLLTYVVGTKRLTKEWSEHDVSQVERDMIVTSPLTEVFGIPTPSGAAKPKNGTQKKKRVTDETQSEDN